MMMKTSPIAIAALCTLLCSASVNAGMAQYLRIYHFSDSPNSIINLNEVQAYDCSGNLITPVSANMTGTYPGWPASNCIDGNLGGTGCHTTNLSNSYLELNFGHPVAISNVTVTNRPGYTGRIVGYSIALFSQADGAGLETVPQTFATAQSTYQFTFAQGGCPSDAEVLTMSALGLARFVQIWRSAVGIINLGEIQVFDCNGDYVTPAAISMSSTHPAWPGQNCINNDLRNPAFCHTANEANASLTVDLGRYVNVAYVKVQNRVSCCQDRIAGYNIGLFAGFGWAPVGPSRLFVGTHAYYDFTFAPCSSASATAMTLARMSQQLGMARYIRIYSNTQNTSSILNLNEVMPYDCDGNYIVPTYATMSTNHIAGPALNCINNDSNVRGDFCHTNAPTDNWLQIDLGSAQNIGTVVVRNRNDCCSDRIVGFHIALFNGPDATLQVGSSYQFTSNQRLYNVTTLRSCTSVAAISQAVVAAADSLNQSAVASEQAAIARLNASLAPLSSIMEAESTLLSNINSSTTGGIAAQLGAVIANTNTVSNAVNQVDGRLSTVSQAVTANNQQIGNVGQSTQTNFESISTMTSTMSTQSTATANSIATVSASVTAIRTAINTALAGSSSGTASASPFIGASGSNTLQVASGTCQNNDLCDATSFAASLKQALSSI